MQFSINSRMLGREVVFTTQPTVYPGKERLYVSLDGKTTKMCRTPKGKCIDVSSLESAKTQAYTWMSRQKFGQEDKTVRYEVSGALSMFGHCDPRILSCYRDGFSVSAKDAKAACRIIDKEQKKADDMALALAEADPTLVRHLVHAPRYICCAKRVD